jgi:aspartate racemase
MRGWRTIGVIGGMGPAATVDFLGHLVRLAGATTDAEHPHVLVDSNPAVPDRNAARQRRGPSPGPVLAAMARGLVAGGAQVLAMPCNAAHGWAADIRAAVDAPLVDMIGAAVARAAQLGDQGVGLMAVDATLDARLYHEALASAGLAAIEPDRAAHRALVARVKAGDTGAGARAAARAIADALAGEGAGVIIMACTEVPLVLQAASVPLVDATRELALATLAAARLGTPG